MSQLCNEIKSAIINHEDLDERRNQGDTFLHQAVVEGDEEAVRLLLEKDVNIYSLNDYNQTPLFFVFMNENEGIVKAFTEFIIKEKETLEFQDSSGYTPLHSFISMSRRTDAMKLLIKASIEKNRYILNFEDHQGQNPLHIASIEGETDIVKDLIEGQAELDRKDHKGQTPLHCAVINGHTGIVNALLGAQAALNLQDHQGQTPASLRSNKWTHKDCQRAFRSTGSTEPSRSSRPEPRFI